MYTSAKMKTQNTKASKAIQVVLLALLFVLAFSLFFVSDFTVDSTAKTAYAGETTTYKSEFTRNNNRITAATNSFSDISVGTVSRFIGEAAGVGVVRTLGDYMIWEEPTKTPTIYKPGAAGTNNVLGTITSTKVSMSSSGEVNQSNPAAAGAVYTINYIPNETGTLKLSLYLLVSIDDGGANSNRASTQVAVTDDATQAVKFRTYNSTGIDDFTLEYSGADQYDYVSAQMNSTADIEKYVDISLDCTAGKTNTYYLYVAFTRGCTPLRNGAQVHWEFRIDEIAWTYNTYTTTVDLNGRLFV